MKPALFRRRSPLETRLRRLSPVGIACILVLSGAWYVMLFYGGTGVFICLAHAVFRPRSLRGKASRLAEEVKAGGGFTIEVGSC